MADDAGKIYEYYGVVIPDRRFHVSPLCPSLRTMKNWKQGELSGYLKEADAIMMGHLKRCDICFNMYRFNIKINDSVHELLLDKADLQVLIAVSECHKAGAKITINNIAAGLSLGFDKVNDTFKRLLKFKLVSPAQLVDGVVVRGHRKFTDLGAGVVKAYDSKLYGAPMSENLSVTEENRRLT